VLLVFTTIAPSIAVANTGNSSITIHTGSDDRTINDAQGYIVLANSEVHYLHRNNSENGRVQLISSGQDLNPQGTYKVIYSVMYTENEQQYQFIEERMQSGSELAAGTNFTIPPTDKLTTSRITSENPAEEDMKGQLHFGNNKEWSRISFPIFTADVVFASTGQLSAQLSLNGDVGGKKHFLKNAFTIGQDLAFESMLSNASEVTLKNKAQSVNFTELENVNYFHIPIVEDEEIVISNGKYQLSFNNSDGLYWWGDVEISGDKTIDLPTEPTDISFSSIHQYIESNTNNLTLNYSLKLVSGPFELGNLNNEKIQFNLYNGEILISKWTEEYTSGSRVFSAKELKSGTYNLEATLELNGKSFTATKEIQVNSALNTLKGTVITAETSKGEPLKSGNVTLFKVNRNQGYTGTEHLKMEQIKEVDGVYEAFIPDAYILDGIEYLLIVQDYNQKTAYLKKIIGQEQKEIHFKADSLKEIKLDVGELTTLDLHSTVVDPQNNNLHIPLHLDGQDWKIGSDFPVVTRWNGHDAKKIGYSWSGLIGINKDEVGDIANATWKTLKPASKYANATLSLNGGTANQFKQLNFSYYNQYIEKSLYMEVVDGETKYSSYLYLPDPQENNEVSFSTYRGWVNIDPTQTIVFTRYYDNYGSDINVESPPTTHSFTYELYDGEGKPVGERITSTSINSFPLPADLPKGNYTVKLVDSTLNPEIVTLELDAPLTLGEDVKGNAEILSLTANLASEYGQVEPRWGSYIEIFTNEQNSEYYHGLRLNWNHEKNNAFESHYPVTITKDRQYTVKMNLFIPRKNTWIMEEVLLTGEQLLNINAENPLEVSDNLNLITLDYSGLGQDIDQKVLYLEKTSEKGMHRYTNLYFESHTAGNSTDAAKVYLLVSNESYSGTFVARDWNTNANVRVFDIPSFNSSTNQELFFKKENIAKITVEKDGTALRIYGHSVLQNVIARGGINTGYSSISHSKGKHDQLEFYVAVTEKFDTPWGYNVKARNINLEADKTFNFTGAITGDITSTSIYQYENGNHGIGLQYSLTSGDFQVERIFHAVESNHSLARSLSVVTDPIRDYTGLFESENTVPVVYSLKDKQGKVIWEQTSTYYSLSNAWLSLDKELEQGTYTLQVHIPTAPRKSLTLKKEIVIAGESMPFVQIDSPKNGFLTNEQNVHVTGTANKEAIVTVELQKEDKTIESLAVKVDTNGHFSHKFKPNDDGDYTIVANHEKASAAVTFVIDRTSPEKATNIKFVKDTAGLNVSWTGAKDTVSYKVEVAEGSNSYKALSEQQTATTAVIPNIKPGATYNVKVTSYDKAGNASVSDVASYEVPGFIATSISVEDKRNADKLLAIGEELKVTLEGSYAEGYTASAIITADGVDKEIELSFNKEQNAYEGTYVINEGTKEIEKVTGSIADESSITEGITKDLAWSIGSTVKGLVSDGEPVKNATVRLFASNKTLTATTNAAGEYVFKAIPAYSYKVTVLVEGKTFAQESIEVGKAVVKTIKPYTLPAFTNATINLVDVGTNNQVKSNLSVRLTGPKGFAAYGTTSNGKFKTFDGKDVLTKLETGEYVLTVYGQGAYNTTNVTVTLVKGTTEYKIEVSKVDVVEKDITITFDEKVESVSSISLHSHLTYAKYQYNGIGSHYAYNVKPDENGKVIIKGVALSDDYELHVAVEGFMSIHESGIKLTENQEIKVELEAGRKVTGTVTDSSGNPAPLVDVYGYSGNTYYSAKTDSDGRYTLIGLSKENPVQVDVYSQIYLNYNEKIDKGKNDTELNIQLSKAATITGKVVDRNGKALGNVSVSASGDNSYGWSRTAPDGTFTVTGLADTKKYSLTLSSYGYPTVTLSEKEFGDVGTITLQAEGDGKFDGEGNFFAVSKSSVVPGDEVQFTLSYKNNGTIESKDVPVEINLPEGLKLIPATVTLNGKSVEVTNNKVSIPKVAAKADGKITFSAIAAKEVVVPSFTATAKVTKDGTVLSATTSVVFVTLEAPSQTGSTSVKVYGNAKYGSTIEVYADNKLVGQTKVDSKWWYADVKLPVTDSAKTEEFTLTAKVTDGGNSVFSKPISVTYEPNVPQVTDVTVHAGWNGDVKLNPYTGVATFAIVEHTRMDTKVVFDKEIDSAKITFLGETYDLVKGKDNKTFTFDGSKLGRWTSYGEQLLELTFKKDEVEITMPLMNIIVLIDPSGFVFEGSMDTPLEGVQAIVETKIENEWVQWDAAKFGQINPQVTDEEGRYGWDVLTGLWRVIFTKDGYEPYISRVMDVPPPEIELNIPMVRNTDPAIRTTKVSEKELTVEFDRLMDVTDKATLVQLFEEGSDTPLAGTVQTVDVTGYKSLKEVPLDKLMGFVEKDSRKEFGFFDTDSSKKFSKTINFVPADKLKADTDYKLVVNGQLVDYSGKILGDNKEFAFTTEKDSTEDGGNTDPEPNPEPTPDTDQGPGPGPGPGTGTGGSGSGGSSGGGAGGGAVAPPVQGSSDGKEVINPTTGDKTVIVDEKSIAEKIIDSKQQEIIIPLTSKAGEKVNALSATISAKITKQIIESKKPLVVTANGASVSLTTEVLKALVTKGGDNIKISIREADPKKESLPVISGNSNILSSLYDFNVVIQKGGKEERVTTFATPITITTNIEKVKDIKKVAAYYLNEKTNKWEYIGGRVQGQQFTFKVSHFSKYAVIENDKTFKDIQSGNSTWAREYIEVLASKTIIQGKTADTFAPNDQITRTQFTLLLSRALNLPEKSYEGTFSDVTDKMDWMVYEIEAANRAGIITGNNGEFRPNEKITRQQMAAMIIRAIDYQDATLLEGVNSTVTFTDAAAISDYAQQNVGLAVSLGIISGREVDGGLVFSPKENATRAHAAKMLYYLLEMF